MITYIRVDIYVWIFPQHIVLAKKRKCKRKGEYHRDSCIKVGSKYNGYTLLRGKQRLSCAFWLGALNINATERHFILPLVIENFIMQSVAFISSISQICIKLIFLTLKDSTYLESNFYCLHR